MKVLNSVQSKCQSVDMNFGLQKKNEKSFTLCTIYNHKL